MKKILGLTAVGVAVGAVCVAAWAANLSNVNGQSCGDFTGTWHFVNNQTGGAAPGLLQACFTSGCTTDVQPYKVLTSTQHFTVTASGTLLSGSSNLPGRLVLSDFTCSDKKDECDPKKPETCPK